MKKTWKTMLATMALLFSAAVGQAADKETVAVVSISSYDNLVKNVATIGEVAGYPDLDQMVDAILTLQTGGKGLVGVDKTKPWGVQVKVTQAGPGGVAFLPVNDLKGLLGALAGVAGEAEDVGDGVYSLENGPAPVFVKAQGNWAFIGQSKESLANLPKDPVALLDGLPEEYTVAVRGYVQNIPEEFRQMAVGELRKGLEAGMVQGPDESDEDFKIRKQAGEASVKQMERMINEIATITIGWTVDMESKQTYIDIAQSAVPGTMLAKQIKAYAPSTSDFGGFLRDGSAASLLLNSDSELSDSDKENFVTQMNGFRDRALMELDNSGDLTADQKKVVKQSVGDIFRIMTDTMASGKYDGGAIITTEPLVNIVVGGHVADGKGMEEALKNIGKLIAEDPNAPKINWDAETYKAYTFHHATTPILDDDAKALFGDNLQFAVAVSGQGIFIALGADAVGSIKKVIDASEATSEKELPILQGVVALGPIMNIAAEAEDDPTVAMMAEMLKGMKGNDRVIMQAFKKGDSAIFRLSVDEGVIKLIGQAAGALGGAGGGGGFPGGPGGDAPF